MIRSIESLVEAGLTGNRLKNQADWREMGFFVYADTVGSDWLVVLLALDVTGIRGPFGCLYDRCVVDFYDCLVRRFGGLWSALMEESPVGADRSVDPGAGVLPDFGGLVAAPVQLERFGERVQRRGNVDG